MQRQFGSNYMIALFTSDERPATYVHMGKTRQASSAHARRAGLTTAVLFACAVGTGGESSPKYFDQRAERGYSFDGLVLSKQVPHAAPNASFAEQLARVREALPTSISALASAFGVSRQTIYDWQNGTTASIQSQEKLRDLMTAADTLIKSGVSISGHLLKRPIHGTQSLLDVCRTGGSTANAANELVKKIRKEQNQLEAVSLRLAARASRTDMANFGAPSFGEHG